MTATVNIESSKKERLDRFLASVLLKEGIRITMQEALGLIVDYALESEEDLIRMVRKLPPLEDDPAWRELKSPKHWGVKGSSRRIDEFLYGR